MKSKKTKSDPKSPHCGRLHTKGIRVVGEWKEVKIDPNVFADGQMDDLVCFEELTDYHLVSTAKNSSGLFTKGTPKKRKAQADAEDGEREGEPSSSKKKLKLKSKAEETEGAGARSEFEVRDAEPAVPGGSVLCPPPEGGELTSKSLAQAVPKKKKKKGKKVQPPQDTNPKVPKKAKTWVPEARDHKADVSAWKGLFVPKQVLRALSFLGFSAPTPIQAFTLAPAIRDKLDILGAAETGEGRVFLVESGCSQAGTSCLALWAGTWECCHVDSVDMRGKLAPPVCTCSADGRVQHLTAFLGSGGEISLWRARSLAVSLKEKLSRDTESALRCGERVVFRRV